MKFRFAHFFINLAFFIVMGHALVPHCHDRDTCISMQKGCELADWQLPFGLDMGEHHLENYQKPSSDLSFFLGMPVPLGPELPEIVREKKSPATWQSPLPPLIPVYIDFPSLRAPPLAG